MLLLICGPTEKMMRQPNVGFIVTPRKYHTQLYRVRGKPWAMDNDCFQGLDRPAFISMLKRNRGIPGCLWVTAPDVVADAASTLTRFKLWYPVLKYFGYPVAFVAQDGIENSAVPWPYIECLFVGGSTAFKLGEVAAKYVKQAKSRGKWVHVGRVNSRKRMLYASSIGADSVDGTGFSRFGDKYNWGPGYAGVTQTRFEGF